MDRTTRSKAQYSWAGMPVHKEHLRASASRHVDVRFRKLMDVAILVVVSKKLKEIRAIGKEYNEHE